MKINKKMQDALNGQVNAEFHAAYLYLGMAAYFEGENLSGCAAWMYKQYNEEVEHAMKIFKFVLERGGEVQLEDIKKGPTKYKSPLEAFQAASQHEQLVTGLIYDLVDLAKKEGDKASELFLQWYVDEQVEEEAQVDEIVEKLKKIGNSVAGLMVLDGKLGARKE